MEKAVNDYRYERKFCISGLTLQETESLIKLHPALFTNIYHPRYVNNIYCDSFSLKNYFDNIDGATQRAKIRIRWYGDLFGPIKKPMLELKIKKGLLGTKKSYPLNPFSLDNNFTLASLIQLFQDSNISPVLKLKLTLLEPTLLNRYRRAYYRSADNNYRITLDSDMEFYTIRNSANFYLHKYSNSGNVILELKYSPDKDQSAEGVVNFFPFRMTKNSKYVNGIEGLSL